MLSWNIFQNFFNKVLFIILRDFPEFADAFRRFNLATMSKCWNESDASNSIISIIYHTISTHLVLEYISEFLQQSSNFRQSGIGAMRMHSGDSITAAISNGENRL